jgi:GMP synthase-like glutamine amidotransferase
MRILVFQHVDVEHPGVFRDFWNEAGIPWDAVELDAGEPIPPLEQYDLMVVMGGPMDVWQEDAHPWLKPEIEAIRRWVMELKRPYLGVCLGHQLLAEAIGGEVGPGGYSEVGLTPVTLTLQGKSDPFFHGLGPELETFQWHSAEIKCLPEGAVVLAKNGPCAVQAFRFGSTAYGLQYHVEITDQTIPEWHAIPEYAASLADAIGADAVPQLTADTTAKLPTFNAVARQLNDNLMSIIEADRLANAS